MAILRFLVPLALIAILVFLVSRTDVHALRSAFSQVSIGHVIFGLLLVQVQVVASALRWRFTAMRLGETIPATVAVSEYYVASFLNQTLPGGVAGDAIRAYRMRNAGNGGWKGPAKAVVFERLSGQAAFFVLALSGLIAWPFVLGGEEAGRRASLLVLCFLMLVVTLGLVLVVFGHRSSRFRRIKEDVALVFLRRGALAIQFGLSVLAVGSYVATFILASHAVGAPLPWIAALTIIPLCLIAMLVPAGFGGWGTREAAAMALWPLLGATQTEGLAASLVYGGLSLAGALPGLAIITLEAIRGRPRRA
ncbi:flippase-like domain-containing protein [Rhizobium sp. AQ_MP]|nr:lysylphosphatidylglycerol synthase transmembrane domain-containing protein [Rhizobium sp. AQ_MP]MBC2771689.1 flippase-like domain-containing protein [Rhizobium sp. AQ_MP]